MKIKEPMKVFKFTSGNLTTHSSMSWKPGEANTAPGRGNSLCNENWLHCFSDIRATVMFLSHTGCNSYRRYGYLWVAQAEGNICTELIKMGTSKLTILRAVKAPVISSEKKLEFTLRFLVHILETLKDAKSIYASKDRIRRANRLLDTFTNKKNVVFREFQGAKSGPGCILDHVTRMLYRFYNRCGQSLQCTWLDNEREDIVINIFNELDTLRRYDSIKLLVGSAHLEMGEIFDACGISAEEVVDERYYQYEEAKARIGDVDE